MKKIIAMLALVASFNAVAANSTSVDLSKLSPEQQAQITKQVEEMTKDPANISASVRKEAEAWGELGANMGKAMVGAAREVGVAANEFGQTSLGKIVVAIVTYKVVGQEILGVIFGSLILVFGYSLAIWVFTTRRWSKVKYEYEPVMWGMFKRARLVSCETDDGTVTGKFLVGSGLLILTSVVGLNTIF